MAERRQPQNGLFVFDPRVVAGENLAAVGAGATDSSYTEAEPVPGVVDQADGALVPVVSNAQGDDTLTLTVARSGFAGRAALTYSLGS